MSFSLDFVFGRRAEATRRVVFFSRAGVRNGFELNFVGRHWSLRIARYQVALWHDCHIMFGWLHDIGWYGAWQALSSPENAPSGTI